MQTFVMITRLSPDALSSPASLDELARTAMEHISSECPKVEWLHNYAILGPCDYLDIFLAPDTETAMKVATIIRTYAHANTEIWTAIEWDKYKKIFRSLKESQQPHPRTKASKTY